MNTIRFVLALALLLWAPAWSQTAEPQRSSLPSRELAPAQLLAELLKGGYILFFRHAATDFSQNDEKMKSYEDCANQRNLIDRGRSDARAAASDRPRSMRIQTPHLGFGRLGGERATQFPKQPALAVTALRAQHLDLLRSGDK